MREGSQKRFSTSSALFLAALMALSGFGVFMLTGAPPAQGKVGLRQIIEKGDITVTGDVSYSNETWRVTGDIKIYSGGKLTLDNMTIYMNCSTDGEYGIYVYSGGELIIKSSTITTTNTTALIDVPTGPQWVRTWGYHWKFYIYGKATLLNSTFSYLWGGNTIYYQSGLEGGVVIFSTDDVLIQGCRIEKAEGSGIFIGSSSFSLSDNPFIKPKIYNNVIDNSTSHGIMSCVGHPEIVGNVISNASYRGVQFFLYGEPLFKNNIVKDCGSGRNLNSAVLDATSTGGVFIDFIYYSGTVPYIFEGNTIINNSNGLGVRRVSRTMSNNCHVIVRNNTISNNWRYGIYSGPVPTSPSSFYVIDAIIENNTVSSNGWDGIYFSIWGNFQNKYPREIKYNRIYGNGKNGILIGNETSGVSVNIYDNNIYNNGKYGIECIGGGGSYYSNDIHDNTLGGIHISGGVPSVFNNTIDVSGADVPGVLVERSTPSLYNNTITGSGESVLMKFSDVHHYNVRKNLLTGGGVALEFTSSSYISFEPFTITGSDTGLFFNGCDHATISDVTFSNVNNAFVFNNTKYSTISGLTITSNRDAITLLSNSSVLLNNATMGTVGGYATVMDGNSTLKSMNTTLPLAKVSVRDPLSTLEVFWPVFIRVEDEGGYPLEEVEVKFANVAGQEWTYYTPADGRLSWIWMEEYYFTNGTSTVLNPYNISVYLPEYIPQWGDHNINRMLSLQYTLEFNYPPGSPRQLRPLQTHNVTPTLTWEAPDDPNGDVLSYTIEIYEDVVSPGTLFYSGTSRDTSFFVERPMKYHHSYYVKITAHDPWGKSSEKVFKVDVVNTPPDRPGIRIVPSPASSVEDLTVNIVSPSEDPDTNPVDVITYIYTWYVNGVPVQEGESNTLSHHYTKEGDVVSIKVTPFDGIDYGTPATLDVHIVNFAPYALVEEVNLTTEEDTPLVNTINLNDYFADRDLDVLSFTAKEERHLSAVIDPVTGNLTIYPEENWNGRDYLIISASDGRARVQPDPTIKIWVTVNSLNDPPVITSVNSIPLRGGEVELESLQNARVVLRPVATDPDMVYGDALQFSTDAGAIIEARGVPIDDPDLEYSFDGNTGEVSFKLLNALVGDLTVELTVADSAGEEFTARIIIHVRNLNDPPTPPVIVSPADHQEFGTLTVSFTADPSDDPDLHIPASEESLTYIWDFGDGETVEGEELEVTHTYRVPGTYTVTLTVRDSSGLSRSTSITIKVSGEIEKPQYTVEKREETFLEKYYGWLILIVVAILIVIGLLVLLKKKEPLEEVAEAEEKDLEQLKAAVAPALPPPEEAPPEAPPETAPPEQPQPEEAPPETPPPETPPEEAPPEAPPVTPPPEEVPAETPPATPPEEAPGETPPPPSPPSEEVPQEGQPAGETPPESPPGTPPEQ